MKRILTFMIISALALTLLVGGTGCEKQDLSTGDSLKIVCTLFPVYDWVKNITDEMDPSEASTLFGDMAAQYGGRTTEIETVLLFNNGTDLHSYQATADDIVNISTCDLLIYVGGESDAWVKDALKNSTNPDQRVICLMDEMENDLICVGHDHDHGHSHEHGDHTDYDEHVWLSLKNAARFCEKIASVIKELDPENQALYSINEERYLSMLGAHDRHLADIVSQGTKEALIFADRFPFAYLMRDYGIEYYAAFEGCTSETDASFDTILNLAKKADELSIEVFLTTEKTDGNVAEAVRAATAAKNQKSRPLNSMQSVSPKDIDNGISYLEIMEENIAILKEALN